MSGDPGLRPDPAGIGLLLGTGVELAEGISFGAYVIVHDGTAIGAGCTIGDRATLGRRPALSPHSSARGEVGKLVLSERCSVGTGAVVFAGARIGAGALLGDQSFVRERCVVGEGTVIGRGSALDSDVHVGAGVRIQTGVYLAARTVVEDGVFLGPGVLTTNDDTMGRHGPATPLQGATLRRACRIGGGAVIVPGVEVGEEAFVAAGAVVTRDVPARARVMGIPARVAGQVEERELLERWR